MRWIAALLITLAAMIAMPSTAHAEATVDATAYAAPALFAGAAIDDAELADIRGGQTPFAPLTRRAAVTMQEAQFASDARQTAGVAGVTFDVWFASTGADLIAANLRAPAP